jgi:hypothetical protein
MEEPEYTPRPMLAKYEDNPKLRLKHLMAFRERLMNHHILGEQDYEYRKELEFVLERCNETITEVRGLIFMKGIDDDNDGT